MIVLAVAMLVALAGCEQLNPAVTPIPTESVSPAPTSGPAESPNPTPVVTTLGSLTGAWKGTWTNTSPVTAAGTFVLTWAQQGDLLFGAIGVTGSNCITAGNVTGNVDGTKISFGAVEGGTSIQYEGVVSGTIMTGSYHSDCGNSTGTWTAVKA